MNRRKFLASAGASAAASLIPAPLHADASAITVYLRDVPSPLPVPLDFTGLSYELAQLTDPTFFSSNSRDLIACFKLLSPNGILRLGGNTSEFCWFKATQASSAPKLHVPPGNLDANWMPHQLFEISPQAIDELAGFLSATGWRLIYGLNFGNSTPARAAEEAAYVAQKIGERLVFFQIGNEPDLYTKASNGTRPLGWTLSDYVNEWAAFADAILARVPNARFGGPDVAASSDWIARFAAQLPERIASKLVALTGHYYAEGPPDDPTVTTERLLAGNPKIESTTRELVSAARERSRIYRMTEGNSCYRGGKPGMSDAFASALWAGDYMLKLASLGCAGVNLHGGRSQFLTAGLGGHTPGMQVAKTPQEVHSGFYTPIRSEPGKPSRAMPIFYGMMLANQFAGATMMRVEGDLHGMNVSVFAAREEGQVKVAAFNKDERTPAVISIRGDMTPGSQTIWSLRAPGLDSTSGVTFAGASISPDAQWHPTQSEAFFLSAGTGVLHLPPASAALMFLKH